MAPRIYQQDQHLAVAFLGSMMWTLTIAVREPGLLQIESSHNP
jgi:hypothetical protein